MDFTFIGLVLAVAAISYTVSFTSIFAGLREKVERHTPFGELIHCPYCLSHYVAFIIMLFIDPFFDFCANPVINFIISWFAVIGGVALAHYIMLLAYIPVAQAGLERRLSKRK